MQVGYDVYFVGIKVFFECLGLGDVEYDVYVVQLEVVLGVGNLILELVMN